MQQDPCLWPAELLAYTLQNSSCKDFISLCSTSKECERRCSEIVNFPEFSENRKMVVWNCILHNIFNIIRDDSNLSPPGWEWDALTDDMFIKFNTLPYRNLDDPAVAYISFNEAGNGNFHIYENVDNYIDTFEAIVGDVSYNILARNEIEFTNFSNIENFATQFAQKFNLTFSRQDNDSFSTITFDGPHRDMTTLYELVSTQEAKDTGFVRFKYDQNTEVKQNFPNVMYNDYFTDPNEADIKWVATQDYHILIEWESNMNPLSFSMYIRNPVLRSRVSFAFKVNGCSIVNENSDEDQDHWMQFEIPDIELETIPRTRALRKQYQRRAFFQLFPFLVCDRADQNYEKYIDIVPMFRPESFSEAFLYNKYKLNE